MILKKFVSRKTVQNYGDKVREYCKKNKGKLYLALLASLILLFLGYEWVILIAFIAISFALDLIVHKYESPIHFNVYLFFGLLLATQYEFFPYTLIFLIVAGPFPEIVAGNPQGADYLVWIFSAFLVFIGSSLELPLVVLGIGASILEQLVNAYLRLASDSNPVTWLVGPAGELLFNIILFSGFSSFFVAVM